MKKLLAVFKKELKGYVDHPTAYILAVVFLVLNNFLFFRSSLVQSVASMRTMFSLIPWIFIFFISALTMRSWAEERREKTLSVLLSYPTKVWKIVLGKFLATSVLVSFILLLTLLIPLGLGLAGDFDWGVVAGQYLGSIFLIMALVAIGQWASSLTKNQVVSFIISIGIQVTFVIIGMELVVIGLPYPLNQIAQQLGILSHFSGISRGVLDIRDILYFLSLVSVFLSLNYAWLIRLKSNKKSAAWKKLKASVAMLIGIAVVINLFGQSFTLRWDLTEQNLYSLSPATKSLLRDLDDRVRITVYRSKKLPTQVELVNRDVMDIVNDYSKFGGRNVDIEIKYPDKDDESKAAAVAAGIATVQFNVYREDEFTLQEGYHGLIVEYLDGKEVMPFIQSINDLEYNLTRAINSLQSDDELRLGYVSDFGGKGLEELTTLSGALRELYTVEQIALATESEEDIIPEIDDSIDVLFIAAPSQSFSAPALTEIEKYIKKGGKIFWLLGGTTVDQARLTAAVNDTGLDSLLALEGITIRKDVVADLSSHSNVSFSTGIISYILPYPYWAVAKTEPHVIAGNVQQVMLPWSSSIVIAKESENIKPLFSTTDSGVALTGNFPLNPNQLPDFNAMSQGEYLMGVTVENVASDPGQPAGRWVVLASSAFIDDSIFRMSPQNGTYVLNALDWLLQNEALLSIRSKDGTVSLLVWESPKTQKVVRWGNTVGVPLVVVLFGVIWIWRRRRLKIRII